MSKEQVKVEKKLFSLMEIYPDPNNLLGLENKPIEEIKENCLVILDTNVLLLPFTISSESIDEIKKVYEQLVSKDRLFIPSQVAREFVKNRSTKLTELYSSLAKKRNNIQNIETKKYPILSNEPNYDKIINLEKEINLKIKEYRDLLGTLLDNLRQWNLNDPVSVVYREIFKSNVIYDLEINSDIESEIRRRISINLPPGYKDQHKDDNFEGDILIWLTILDIAKLKNKDVIFVTGEEKSDWWHKSEGKAIYPRYELIDEFKRTCNNSIHIVQLSDLLNIYNVTKTVVAEIHRNEKFISKYESFFNDHNKYVPLFNHEDDDPTWETDAKNEIKNILENAEWDYANNRVTIIGSDARMKNDVEVHFTSLQELVDYLVEESNSVYYSSVPFSKGSAIYEDNSHDWVYEELDNYSDNLIKLKWDY